LLRKPLSLIILSIIFFLSPFVILAFNAAINMVPLIGYGSIIFRLQFFDVIILCLYMITGISIFLVRKWGWWIIIFSAIVMIVYNLFTLFLNPFSSLVIVLIMNFLLFSITLFFFRKHIIAPYFNPQLRWWNQDQRYEIDIYLKFLGIDKNVIISDISEGGCYIFVDFLIETGSELPLLIVCGSFRITLDAKIMRISRESERYYGYGLMFQKIDDVAKDGLEQLLTRLKSFSSFESDNADADEKRGSTRFFIANDLSISCDQEDFPVNLSDLSKSGCSLHTSLEIDAGRTCSLHLRIGQRSHSIPVRVIWKKNERDKRQYGLKFIDMNRSSRLAVRHLITSISHLGAKKREFNKSDYNRQCEDKLDNTPYGLVLLIKKLFKRDSR